MTQKEYKKFRKIFNEKGDKERFYLQEIKLRNGGLVSAPKLRMNNTTFIEETVKDKDMHHGIYIDIFLLHGCPKTKWDKKKAVIAEDYIIVKNLSNRNYRKRKALVPLMRILKLFSPQFGLNASVGYINKWKEDDGDMLADYGLYNSSTKYFVDKSIYHPYEPIEYMGRQYYVPHEVEKYLELCYGDWKKIPDIKKIMWGQHSSEWSLNEDFRKYAPNVVSFKDEIVENM